MLRGVEVVLQVLLVERVAGDLDGDNFLGRRRACDSERLLQAILRVSTIILHTPDGIMGLLEQLRTAQRSLRDVNILALRSVPTMSAVVCGQAAHGTLRLWCPRVTR